MSDLYLLLEFFYSSIVAYLVNCVPFMSLYWKFVVQRTMLRSGTFKRFGHKGSVLGCLLFWDWEYVFLKTAKLSYFSLSCGFSKWTTVASLWCNQKILPDWSFWCWNTQSVEPGIKWTYKLPRLQCSLLVAIMNPDSTLYSFWRKSDHVSLGPSGVFSALSLSSLLECL